MQPIHRMKLHKVMIQSLAFSKDERYLASLGGQDDNQLVTWDVSSPLRAAWLAPSPMKLISSA